MLHALEKGVSPEGSDLAFGFSLSQFYCAYSTGGGGNRWAVETAIGLAGQLRLEKRSPV